jgi:predicted nucleotidyltransferase component of viral defense system
VTKRPVPNTAASVRQRLLNLARANGRSFNEVVQHYALERWLYRLSCSEHAARFVLKGALLLRAWAVPAARPTRDIDLLARTGNDLDAVRRVVGDICQTAVEPDGMEFDPGTVVTERISEDADYEGVRATFQGLLGTVRCAMQTDMGFSDVVTPGPVEVDYPTILDLPAPHLRAYNRETAIAEKLEAMVKLGELNSRMKDFFDIWALCTTTSFNGRALVEAVAATFRRRGTAMDTAAVCFTDGYARQDSKAAQWRAFVRRSELRDAPQSFPAVWQSAMAFLRPVADAVERGGPLAAAWPAGGPWQPEAR